MIDPEPLVAITAALTAAAYQCDGNCRLPEHECFNSHPINWSGMAAGHTHITGSAADIAEVALAAIRPQIEALARVQALAADMRTWCSPYGIAVDYADRIDDAINGPLEPADGRNPIVIHACPPDGSGVTPCCGRTPFELPRKDRMTTTPSHATCPGTPTTH